MSLEAPQEARAWYVQGGGVKRSPGSQEKPTTGHGQYVGPSEHSPLQPLEKAATFLPQEQKSEAVHDSKL